MHTNGDLSTGKPFTRNTPIEAFIHIPQNRTFRPHIYREKPRVRIRFAPFIIAHHAASPAYIQRPSYTSDHEAGRHIDRVTSYTTLHTCCPFNRHKTNEKRRTRSTSNSGSVDFGVSISPTPLRRCGAIRMTFFVLFVLLHLSSLHHNIAPQTRQLQTMRPQKGQDRRRRNYIRELPHNKYIPTA